LSSALPRTATKAIPMAANTTIARKIEPRTMRNCFICAYYLTRMEWAGKPRH